MKIAASLFAAMFTLFGLAVPAGAKEKIVSAKICGATDCVTVTDSKRASALAGSRTVAPPPPAAGFYTVELAMGAKGRIKSTFYYVPSAAMTFQAFRVGQATTNRRRWETVSPAVAALFRKVAQGLEPFPTPRLASARVGTRTVVQGADSYLRLFELPSTSPAGGSLAYAVSIDLRSTRQTPWTDSASDLSFSPKGALLARGGQAVRLPETVLADLLAGRALAS